MIEQSLIDLKYEILSNLLEDKEKITKDLKRTNRTIEIVRKEIADLKEKNKTRKKTKSEIAIKALAESLYQPMTLDDAMNHIDLNLAWAIEKAERLFYEEKQPCIVSFCIRKGFIFNQSEKRVLFVQHTEKQNFKLLLKRCKRRVKRLF